MLVFLGHVEFSPCSKMVLSKWYGLTSSHPTPAFELSQVGLSHWWLGVVPFFPCCFPWLTVIGGTYWGSPVLFSENNVCTHTYTFVADLRVVPSVSLVDFSMWQLLHAEYLWWLVLGFSRYVILSRSTLGKKRKSNGEKSSTTSLSPYLQASLAMSKKSIVNMMTLEGASGYFQQVEPFFHLVIEAACSCVHSDYREMNIVSLIYLLG